MELDYLLRGCAIGFSIAAPVGPIGVLCIRRTLADGRARGFASGLGAAAADALYGCVAAFGLTAISGLLVRQQMWLRLVGGLFLLYLGVKTFFTKSVTEVTTARGGSLPGAFASTFVLTLTNPATILSFVAVFAGLGIGAPSRDFLGAGLLVLGVFIGSAFWWLLLSTGVSVFREKFDPRRRQWVNRISGIVIAGFSLIALWSLRK
jgi:threonine/homoserine/homoserine lactone efflux protein